MIKDKRIAISPRSLSLTAGILYLLTFVSVPTLSLYTSVHQPDYIIGTGPDTDVFIGAILEIVVALAGIGTAAALYPILKRQNEVMAIGLVGSRVLEAGTIFAGVAFLLSVVTLRQNGAGTDALSVGHALVGLYDRIFLIGQSFMPVINDLLLGILLFRSRLVPRFLSLVGIIGAMLLCSSDIAVLFGLLGQRSVPVAIATIPVALFEFILGIWLVVKGFNPSAPLVMAAEASD